MSDLVERLRDRGWVLDYEAAAQIERLEGALKKIASDEFDCSDLSAKHIALEALDSKEQKTPDQTRHEIAKEPT